MGGDSSSTPQGTPEPQRSGARKMLRYTLATILVLWIFQFAGLTTMRLLRVPEEGLQYVVPRAIVTVGGVGLSLVILFAQNKAWRASLPLRTLFAIACALIGSLLHGAINEFVFAGFYDSTFSLTEVAISILNWFWFYLSLSAMILVLNHSAEITDSRVQIESLRTEATLAQLSALRYQLNPHFLFNTLNSIAALIVERQPELAERMINRLSDFLRAGLDTDPVEAVPLHAEIVQQQRYLEIEQIRFPNRLAFSFDVAADVEDALVPSLILQPLVENAIKYAVAPSPNLVTVRVKAERAGNMLRIAVRDDGRAASPSSSGAGIGLENVRRRLASAFGDEASFVAGPGEGGGFEVSLLIPLRHAR